MTPTFSAVVSPDAQLLNAIGALAPQSPFDTPAYASALSDGGASPCALVLLEDQQITGGCLAALAGNRDAEVQRDRVARSLDPERIVQSQRRIRRIVEQRR